MYTCFESTCVSHASSATVILLDDISQAPASILSLGDRPVRPTGQFK